MTTSARLAPWLFFWVGCGTPTTRVAPPGRGGASPPTAQHLARQSPPDAPAADAPAADAPAADAPTADAPAGDAPSAGEAPRMFRGRPEDAWLQEMSTRPVVRLVERFSSTAIVYHLDLGGGVEIAFKPERPGQEFFWRHEVVAYRFARAVGMRERVPPTVGRRLPPSVFGRWAARDQLRVTGRDRTIAGAASVWMPVLGRAQLHTPESRRQWVPWLDPARPLPPEAHSRRARQLAEVLFFDYIQSNYDRFNCCNIPVDEHGDIVIRDNDAGWYLGPMRNLGHPSSLRRLPRSLYDGLRRVDAQALRAEVDRDPLARERLVEGGVWAEYDRRRGLALARIEALIARYGASQVLPWE